MLSPQFSSLFYLLQQQQQQQTGFIIAINVSKNKKMKPPCDCCSEHLKKLNQQVSVMRKEIKNLRQMLDSSVRAFRKHLISLQTAVSRMSCCEEKKPPADSPASPHTSLEQGVIQTTPIGFISSCFAMKNGTPRQPTVCGPSRAELRIQPNIFNNPQHALVGLQQFSHVWIIFLFHKNGHLSFKAKVKPPRLNGQKVGVYSTRSPHRPNALGLTLAKLDKIEGDTLHLSDIDMIAGTPVLDIKPYIPDYDCPDSRTSLESQQPDSVQSIAAPVDFNAEKIPLNSDEDEDMDAPFIVTSIDAEDEQVLMTKDSCETDSSQPSLQVSAPKHLQTVLKEAEVFVTQNDIFQASSESRNQVSESAKSKPAALSTEHPCYSVEAARWIREPPIASLDVRFTPQAESQLAEFLPAHPSGASGSNKPGFQFLRSTDEAAAAIRGILSADPRSVYRRTRCKDRLFFFTLDSADVTCWFGEDFAEVLQVRPVQSHMKS